MFKNKAIVIGLFSFLMLFSFAQTSEAELWDFVIDLNVEQGIIVSGDTVVITGVVVDHAYDPVQAADILIRVGSETTTALTDKQGMFRAEFENFQKIPGTYTVNVIASIDDGRRGLASTHFEVKGDISSVAVLQGKLATDEARKYLYSKESDFEKNPIGLTLFKYYHKLLDEQFLKEEEAKKPLALQLYLEQQRKTADELKNQTIEDRDPRYGVFEGYAYDRYIDNLNLEIKDVIATQLDYTKNKFENAQKIRAEILENGGTAEEARQAYFDALSTPREIIEQINDELNEELENSDDVQADDDSKE